MKKRLISFALCVVMIFGIIAMAPISWLPEVYAATASQNNIVARANYLYNSTWVCQKTVAGWRGNYTFYAGSTYHIPYGQPVYSGAYIGYSVSVDDFLAAAADANSIFYTGQSNYAGMTSTYYANDCSAFVSWCWGTSRNTTASIPNISTYIGSASQSNITNYLQLGDALNSRSAGHVVLVTGLTYSGSTLTQIEITEQTPPQLKRSYYTPAALASKYGGSYSIYRYTGTVPEAPSSGSTQAPEDTLDIPDRLKNWFFDAQYYYDKYDDVKEVFGYDEDALYKHFLDYGVPEGRQGSRFFNLKYYVEQSQDLLDAYGTDYEAAFKHFVIYGQYEISRKYSNQLENVRDVIFDLDFYTKKYPDLVQVFGTDAGMIFNHFMTYGIAEGRMASPVFDIVTYLNSNSDLTTSYGTDYYAGLAHFIRYGKDELRVVSPILDVTYYTQNYADLADWKSHAAMIHFMQHGMSEVRQGCASFDPKFYYFANEATLSGTYTESTCYIHYLLTGKDSGLLCVPYDTMPTDHVDLGTHFIATLTNKKSGKNMTIYAGENVIINPASDSQAQRWKFFRQDDGSYEIKNMKYGNRLMAEGSQSAHRTNVVLAAHDDSAGQRWFIYKVGGYYVLRPSCSPYTVIALEDSSTEDGTSVVLGYYKANSAQKYSINIEVACDHSYKSAVTTEATCTTDGVTTYTCKYCSDTYTEAIAATGHSYVDATCTTPQTCSTCGATSGSKLRHDYVAATCTEPKTCARCGKTSGSALGHSYADATCTTPQTCSTCGATSGSKLGHDYAAATCTDPKTCARCGKTSGSALGHSYESLVTDATCIADGYTTHTCGVCGDSYTDSVVAATGHSYTDAICGTCGAADPDYVEPVVVPTMSLTGATLNFEAEIMYNIYFTATDISDVVEMGLITFDTKLTDGTIDNAVTVVPGYYQSGSEFVVHTNGIPAKNLGDAVYFKAYAKLSDGTYAYSNVAGYHAVLYAQDILANSTSQKMKNLVVAMLNYGAAAQTHFGYKTESLMNSVLTDDQKASINGYSADMVEGLTAADSSKLGDFTKTGGFTGLSPNVAFEGAFAINFYLTTANAMDGDLTFYYWRLDDYTAADVLTADNASGVVTATATSNGEYLAVVEGIAAKEIDQTVYISAVYESNGVRYCTGVIAYSLATYCQEMISYGTATMQTFAAETVVYGYYAKQYFA